MKRALLAIGYVWSSPLGLIGLLFAALFWACGWVQSCDVAEGCIWLRARGPVQRWMVRRNWWAVTVGWCVFAWVEVTPELYAHEGRHVDQGVWLGPLFPVAYALCWLVALVQTRSLMGAYSANYLERDARRAAGE